MSVHSKSFQLCLTLWPHCSLPGFSVHGIIPTGILEWVAVSSSRGSSWCRDWTWVSYVSCIGSQLLYHLCHLGSPMCMVVQLLSGVWLFVTPWTAACQASLSFTVSRSLLKLMSIESVMPSSHLNPFSCFQSLPASGSFLMSQLFASGDQSIGASASVLMNMCVVGSIKWELSELWKVNYLDCPEDWGQIIIE